MRRSKTLMVAALTLAAGVYLFPATCGAQAAAAGTEDQLLPVEEETMAGIPFLSGGVGIEERENLRALAEKYNTMLVFALREGNYLASIDVQIADAGGNPVLQTTTQGPWLFATLPEGAYQVEATMQGERISRRIEVREGKVTQTDFRW